MPHLFKITHEWPDARKELPKLGTLAETGHMPFNGIPFDPKNERRRLFRAPAQLKGEAMNWSFLQG